MTWHGPKCRTCDACVHDGEYRGKCHACAPIAGVLLFDRWPTVDLDADGCKLHEPLLTTETHTHENPT